MAIQYRMPNFGVEPNKSGKNYKLFLIVGIIVIVGISVLMILSYYFNNRCYKSYRVENEMERSDSNNVSYAYFNGNIVKYSRSGISVTDNTGKILQNEGFEMKQPHIDICGDYIVAADVTGKQFYVCNIDKGTKSVETTLPIVRAKVSKQGMVAVLLQDTDSNVLNVYNPYSNADILLVEIPTNISEEGYPVDFDISMDGKSVAVSYMVVNGNEIENKVNFYNFTEVGQDKNTLVGGKAFEDCMIGQVEFVGEDMVAVFHEKGITLFGKMKQPEIVAELSSGETIQSVAYSEEYIGIVTGETEAEQRTLHLYDMRGREQLTTSFTFGYTNMKIYGDEIFFLSNHSCHIIRANGREKFSYEFVNGIDTIFPTANGRIYTLVNPDVIQKIRLTAG